MNRIFYLYGFGFGISFDWSSQTGAGSRNGGWGGGGAGVEVGGRIGPVFVLKSTRIENAVETSIDTKTNRMHIICNKKKGKIITNQIWNCPKSTATTIASKLKPLKYFNKNRALICKHDWV